MSYEIEVIFSENTRKCGNKMLQIVVAKELAFQTLMEISKKQSETFSDNINRLGCLREMRLFSHVNISKLYSCTNFFEILDIVISLLFIDIFKAT